MDEKTIKVPSIRFTGFDDTWEQCKLGEVFSQTSNFVNPKEDDIELWSLTVERGLTKKTERYTRDFLVKKEDKYKEVRSGDIVYNPMNMTLGAIGYNNMTQSVAVSGYYVTMFANENIDSYYINTWMKSPQAILLYKNHATGSLIEKQRVQFPTFAKIETFMPTVAEQEKIGTYFYCIDKLITLQQHELEFLKQYKKSMLQKMFPKEGTDVPQIRFAGFNDAWEQRKLGELADIVGGGTPSTSRDEYWDGDIDWYAPAEITNQIFVDSSERKITQEGFNSSSAKMLPVGTVLFTSRAGIGKMAILRKESCTNQGFQSIVPVKNKLDSYFIYSRADELKRYGETVGAGSTFVEVSGKQMAAMELMMPPTMKEQQKIGEYFANLDHFITLHQHELDSTIELKKSMLQKMFL